MIEQNEKKMAIFVLRWSIFAGPVAYISPAIVCLWYTLFQYILWYTIYIIFIILTVSVIYIILAISITEMTCIYTKSLVQHVCLNINGINTCAKIT